MWIYPAVYITWAVKGLHDGVEVYRDHSVAYECLMGPLEQLPCRCPACADAPRSMMATAWAALGVAP